MSAMKRLFQVMADKRASDIYLSVGSPINMKINGNVMPVNQQVMDSATVRALPAVIRYFRGRGYRFVDVFGRTGTGYLVASSNGGVHRFGALRHGSMAGKLPAGVPWAGLGTVSVPGG